jgi:hypothetical protein
MIATSDRRPGSVGVHSSLLADDAMERTFRWLSSLSASDAGRDRRVLHRVPSAMEHQRRTIPF